MIDGILTLHPDTGTYPAGSKSTPVPSVRTHKSDIPQKLERESVEQFVDVKLVPAFGKN
jgi:hypothetical protein